MLVNVNTGAVGACAGFLTAKRLVNLIVCTWFVLFVFMTYY